MKKKLLSLLLVIAVMVTSVSMGFGALTAYAGASGGGIEAINAFSLVDNSGGTSGESFSTTITIKSKVSGYKIKVNSVAASIRYYQDDTSVLNSVVIPSSVVNAICDTNGQTFTITGTISAGLAGLIRYECNYDLLDSSNNVVYAGMTGYGYGYVSANGSQSGAVGTYAGNPGTPGGDYTFDYFNQVNSIYVQTPTITLNYKTKSDGTGWTTGLSSAERSMTVSSGNAPSTLTVKTIYWDGTAMYENSYREESWFVLTEPASGYYNFMLQYDGGNYQNVEMYFRNDSARATAESKASSYLNLGLEKSYYTTASWNNYITQLDKVALAALAMPGPNYAFKIACQTVQEMSGAAALESAKNALVPVVADYTNLDAAITAFRNVKDNTVTVRTYTAGTTELGSTTARLYTQESVDALENDINTYIDRNLYKYQQKTVDEYEAVVLERTQNLTRTPAVYEYLDNAIKEFESAKKSDYTAATWAAYEVQVNNAKALSRSLNVESQQQINTALTGIVTAKINLKYVGADITELNNNIALADQIYKEYDDGTLIVTASGFAETWAEFEEAYANANAVKGYTIDKQAQVDEASNELAFAISKLSGYRILDTKELARVLALTLPDGYIPENYVAESYNTWRTLVGEGEEFIGKASINYTGDDRKTYNDRDEMLRLVEVIQMAFDSLEKVKADFTELDKIVASIPAEEKLALYQQGYVDTIKAYVAMIDYGATFDEQDEVDALANSLKYAIAELTPAHYKDADYTDVDKAIEEAKALDRSIYTNFEIVDNAINAVDRTKKIVDQDEVDAMAAAIRKAIGELDYILADYTDVEEAIKEAEAVENKDWYANYDRIEEIIASIDWKKKTTEQEDVDAYAAAIREAIGKLALAEADYSGVTDAINEAEALEPLTDFTDESVARLDLAISKVVAGYTKDQQEAVNAMEAEIRDALAKMELLPADYSKADAAIAAANALNKEEYSNFNIVEEAIAAIDINLDCREGQDILDEQVAAVYTAIGNLKLLPAKYEAVEKAVEEARNACVSGAYPYTDESIQAVEDVINSINWELDIQHQAEVDAYIPAIQNAVKGLTYIRANYEELDAALEEYNALERELYASLAEIDTYVASLNKNLTIDKQDEVDAMAEQLTQMLGSLEYGEADYDAVDNAIDTYNSLNKNYYEADDLDLVEDAIKAVVRGLKKNEQAAVDKMAQDINYAIDLLKAKMKYANLTDLNGALAAARARIAEMNATGYEIDSATFDTLYTYMEMATSRYNETTKIDQQAAIDDLTAKIIDATAKLEFVFTIDLLGTSLVIDGDYIYGFEEGVMQEDARELIKFVGAAEMIIRESKNGFGTGTTIQFVSTKDSSIIYETLIVVVFGDANGDSVIDMFDVAYISEIANTFAEPSATILKAIDLDPSGFIDATDVAKMLSLANMDATLKQDGSMETY